MAGERRVSGIMETKPKGIFPLREGQRRERESSSTIRGGAQGPRTGTGRQDLTGTPRPGHMRDCFVAPNGVMIAHGP